MTGGWSELSTLGCSPGRQGYGVGALAAPHSPFTERLKPPGAAACPPPPRRQITPSHENSLPPALGPTCFSFWLFGASLRLFAGLALTCGLAPRGGLAWLPGPSLLATLAHDHFPGLSGHLSACGSQTPSASQAHAGTQGSTCLVDPSATKYPQNHTPRTCDPVPLSWDQGPNRKASSSSLPLLPVQVISSLEMPHQSPSNPPIPHPCAPYLRLWSGGSER